MNKYRVRDIFYLLSQIRLEFCTACRKFKVSKKDQNLSKNKYFLRNIFFFEKFCQNWFFDKSSFGKCFPKWMFFFDFEFFVKSWIFGQKSKFLSKIQSFVENPIFSPKSKILIKFWFLRKKSGFFRVLTKKSKVCQKSKIFLKIKIFV